MGTEIRVVVEGSGAGAPGIAAVEVEALIHDFDRRLSRFRLDSELCRLNRDPGSAVPASGLLRTAIRAGLWAAERSGGLVDPTLLEEIEDAGYTSTRDELERVPLAEALADAPPRRPAGAREPASWRAFEVDDDAGEVRRPPGFLFDTGGTGKGLAADLAASRLSECERFVVDCGGDVRFGGSGVLGSRSRSATRSAAPSRRHSWSGRGALRRRDSTSTSGAGPLAGTPTTSSTPRRGSRPGPASSA